MYFPGGKWKILMNGKEGELNIRFEVGFRITGTVFGHGIEGQVDDKSGDISFTTVDGTSQGYTGSLTSPRENYPIAGTYTLDGSVTDASGTFSWSAETYVIP